MDDLPDFRVSPDERTADAQRLQRAERNKRERVEARAQAHFAAMTQAENDAINAKHAAAAKAAAEQHVADLRAAAWAAWTGTAEDFEALWPRLKEDLLLAELAHRQADYERGVRERHPFEL